MKNTFTSSRGIELKLKPVSQFKLDSIKSNKQVVPPPMYTMTLAGGATQQIPMDAEIASNQNREEEWNTYLAEVARVEKEHNERFFELIVWDGVELEVPGKGSNWELESAHFGIPIPEDPFKRKMTYIYNEVIGPPEELIDLIGDVLKLGGVSHEVIERLKGSFRSAVQRATDRASEQGKNALEGESDLQQSASDSLLAQTPE